MNPKRAFDIASSVVLLLVFSLPMLLIAFLVRVTSPGPVLFWSDRVGKDNLIFRMPKFRTMRVGTPAVATHLLSNPDRFLTPIGNFLRKTSLDELPQLFSVLSGEMSLVGPRPALFNQTDLIHMRSLKGIQHLIPGVTGWAQINGRDELPIPEKVAADEYYLKNISFLLDLKILFITLLKVICKDGISH